MAYFDINTAEVHDESNGNKYYKIPIKTKLYRGSDEENSHIVQPKPPPFFGFTSEAVKNYGAYTHTYSIMEELKLLAIMEMNTSSNFYKEAPQNIKNILETNFGYNTKDLRYSPDGYSDTSDKDVMKYLCGKYQSYDGYAMNGLKKKAETEADKLGSGKFHAELAVCGQSLDKVVDEAPSAADGTPEKPRMGVSTGNATRGHVKSRHDNTGDSPNNTDGSSNNTGDSPNNTDGSSNNTDGSSNNTDGSPNTNFVGKLSFGYDSDQDGGNRRIRFKKRGKQTKRKGKRTKKVVIKYKKTRAKRKRGGGKKKTVSFKSCKSDADCWLSEPECDEKNKICVRKKVFHK